MTEAPTNPTVKPQASLKAAAAMGVSNLRKNFELYSPDRLDNTGNLLAELLFWTEVTAQAENTTTKLWKALREREGEETIAALPTGNHVMLTSPTYAWTCKVSEPVRRFDPDTLATSLAKSKYKVPREYTIGLIDKAKIGKNPTRTHRIVERSELG